MYIMWLMCGTRSSWLYSHSVMYQMYSLPPSVDSVLKGTTQHVKDILMKIFWSLPEIMELSCSRLELFKMQNGGSTSIDMDIVCNDGIQPKLPIEFTSLFSIEIISCALFGKHPSLLILIGEDQWILWIGFLSISFDHNEINIIETLLSHYFHKDDKLSDIRYLAQPAMQDLIGQVYTIRTGSPCPLISVDNAELATVTIFLAQERQRALKQKMNLVLTRYCTQVGEAIFSKFCSLESMIELFNVNLSQNMQINDYILALLQVDFKQMSNFQHLQFVIYKCIIERIACLFRNEIHFCVENSFCHSFLCGCFSLSSSVLGNIEERIEKCLSEKMKDGFYCPHMWPSHVISAACQMIPILTQILHSDIQMIISRSCTYVIPNLVQLQTTQRLHNVGMILTNRPPNKPRCPPLLKQVRLWTIEELL